MIKTICRRNKINTLDVSYNFLGLYDIENYINGLNEEKKVFYSTPLFESKSLKNLYINENLLGLTSNLEFFKLPESLEKIEMQSNKLGELRVKNKLIRPFFYNSNLKYIDISRNYIADLENSEYFSFPESLEYLNVKSNNLGKASPYLINILFPENSNLMVLDLSGNIKKNSELSYN